MVWKEELRMKIKLLTRDTISNIMEFVTYINKSNNMTALAQEQSEDGYYVICVESFEEGEQ